MPTSKTKLFAVRLPEAEKRRIKSLAASQGLTLGQAIHEAFEAWASQLQAAAPAPDPARGSSAGSHLEEPGQPRRAATPKPDRGPAAAKPSSTPGGEAIRSGEAPSAAWLRSAARLDWSQCSAVESVPGKSGRVWIVRGTRVPLAAIFRSLAQEHPFEEIAEVFGLSDQQLKAVLQFAIEGVAASRR